MPLAWFLGRGVSDNGGFPDGSAGKESACNAGDVGSIPESRRSLGEGNGNPLQYSCLGNPIDRGAWQATVQTLAGCQESDMTAPKIQQLWVKNDKTNNQA